MVKRATIINGALLALFVGIGMAWGNVLIPPLPVTGTPANNDCAKFVVSGGSVTALTTSAGGCITPASAHTLTNKSIDAGQLTGAIAAGRLPAPAAAALGGVFSKAAISHNFLTSISSADGSVGQGQPSVTDLSEGSTGSGAVVRATSPALVTPTGIVKGDVGLGNVPNVDATNPANLASAVPLNKGGTNGTTGQAAQNNLSGVYVLAQSAVQTGASISAETKLIGISIPANAIGANGRLRVTVTASYPNNANTKTMRIRFGAANDLTGTIYRSEAVTTTTVDAFTTTIANRNATNSQVAMNGTGKDFGTVTSAIITTAVDTTAQSFVVLSGQSTGTDTINIENYIVELLSNAGT